MNPAKVSSQRGAALLALMLVLVLGASWIILDRANRVSGEFAATQRAHNAAVLQRAKQALIGHAAMQAGKEFEDDPGRLPCPEAMGNIGGPNEGAPAGTCAAPAVGRLPWRTIGTEKLLDASGEPLWYVVSPGWHLPGAGAGSLVIHSDTTGQLSVDGVANDAVALVIAPGRAMNVAAAAGCAARNQQRPTPSPAINPLDYLECYNAALGTYMTTGPTGSFNDQVIRITAAELMPGIEGAIAQRIERSVAPVLKTVYASNIWGANVSAANPVYPFAAPFSNPTTSDYQGTTALTAGMSAGLLPFNQTQGCNPATDPRCTTTFLAFSKSGEVQTSGGGSIRTPAACSWQADVFVCIGEYNDPSIALTFGVNVTNVAMGLRTLDLTKVTFTAMNDIAGGWGTQNVPHAKSAVMNANGSVTITVVGGALPDVGGAGWGTYALYRIDIERAAFGDHALLDPTNAVTGWFVRNQWYRLARYVAARGHTAEVLPARPPACPTSTIVLPFYAFNSTCVAVTNVMPAGSQRALLILAGRSINGSVRPSINLGDYFEFGNAASAFESQLPSMAMDAASRKPFNDRVVVIDSN